MPTGSFDYAPEGSILADLPAQIGAYRYDASEEGQAAYTFLPNIYCLQVQSKEGPEPSTAQFQYILDDSSLNASEGDPEDQDETFPSQFEELWPLESPASEYKVVAGDRMVVLETDPEGNQRVLWDGFAQIPQVDLSPRSQSVHFVGVGVAIRLWDSVIGGRVQRDGSKPTAVGTATSAVPTDLPTRFNPADPRNEAGLANCTPDDCDETLEDEDENEYPVFLDPHIDTPADSTTDYRSPAPSPEVPYQTYWTLGKAVRYLLATANIGRDDNDDLWVDNPDFSVLDDLFKNFKPSGSFYDPGDSSTYEAKDILIRDYDATNKPLPEVLWDLLAQNGFRYRFVTEGQAGEPNEDGTTTETPYTYIDFYRFDADGPTEPKQLRLPVSRSDLDPSGCNVSSFSAVQDLNGLVNQWEIETEPIRYEVSVLLAPGFEPTNGDEVASTSTRQKFLLSNLDNATGAEREKYRLWIANEAGQDGYWSIENQAFRKPKDALNDPIDFTDVFKPHDSQEKDADDPNYVERYRPGANRLLSLDPSGKPYRAQLAFSRDYAGADPPCLWDGTGTWQVINGSYRILREKLGIYITAESPEAWEIGVPGPDETKIEISGSLHAITCLSNPSGSGGSKQQQQFWLRLTTVIEGDHCLDAVAEDRPASPYPFTVSRRIDAKDHFKKEVIAKCSAFNTSGDEIVSRDDSDEALAYARQYRSAHEFPPLAGNAHIPWFTRSYSVGDRIDEITGRDVDLQTNAGAEQGEGAYYPFVVAVTWDFRGNQQSTTLQLSDRRTEPRHI